VVAAVHFYATATDQEQLLEMNSAKSSGGRSRVEEAINSTPGSQTRKNLSSSSVRSRRLTLSGDSRPMTSASSSQPLGDMTISTMRRAPTPLVNETSMPSVTSRASAHDLSEVRRRSHADTWFTSQASQPGRRTLNADPCTISGRSGLHVRLGNWSGGGPLLGPSDGCGASGVDELAQNFRHQAAVVALLGQGLDQVSGEIAHLAVGMRRACPQ
jgi:hypothetical protein